MNLRNLIYAILFLMALVGCVGNGSIHVDEVEFRDSLVYFKGSPYTGEVWSTDSLWCLTVEDGRMTAFKLYHANGAAAFTMASPADTLQAFDETGTAMSIDSFAVKYKDIADEIPALINRIHGDLTEP